MKKLCLFICVCVLGFGIYIGFIDWKNFLLGVLAFHLFARSASKEINKAQNSQPEKEKDDFCECRKDGDG